MPPGRGARRGVSWHYPPDPFIWLSCPPPLVVGQHGQYDVKKAARSHLLNELQRMGDMDCRILTDQLCTEISDTIKPQYDDQEVSPVSAHTPVAWRTMQAVAALQPRGRPTPCPAADVGGDFIGCHPCGEQSCSSSGKEPSRRDLVLEADYLLSIW